VIVLGYVTFYKYKQILLEYSIFSISTKWLHGPDEMALQARFDPQAVVGRSLI